MKWLVRNNFLLILLTKSWYVFGWNGIKLQESLKSFLLPQSVALFPCDSIRRIIYVVLADTDANHSTEGSIITPQNWWLQKEKPEHSTCSIWTRSTVHVEVHMMFCSDHGRRWPGFCEVLKRSMQWQMMDLNVFPDLWLASTFKSLLTAASPENFNE